MSKVSVYLLALMFSVVTGASSLEEINKNFSEWDKITDISVIGYNSFSSIDYDFSGIARLPNCSASIVKLKKTLYPKALLLTNGHCMRGFQKPGEVVLNKKYILPVGILNPQGKKIGQVYTTQILYATMTRTDLALLELNISYQELENQYQVKPIDLAEKAPIVGENIEIISGYWKRGFSCAIKNIVYNLKEAGWDFYDSVGYTKECRVYGGTSGSPVLALSSREVIAVNNTGNESGRECKMNNPCEVNTEREISVYKDKGYAQNTFWIYNCLDESSPQQLQFNFLRPQCKLLGPN